MSSPYEAPVLSEIGCWVIGYNKTRSPGAFSAGNDKDNQVFVARSNQFGSWIPGKYIETLGAYVSLEGQEISCDKFEILCLSKMRWQKAVGGEIPANAFIGSKGGGETLYVGRVKHEGNRVSVGKVKSPYNVCEYPMDGREVTSNNFDILVV
ncbi:unnamed protein product [Brassicogethes aeneus]|uniref:Uncharacterized protein n=1 Tax=Brassicogethes aeneus TaxID=1431903 RepID=A0A9P0FGZ7_BRAAE|nr:unnamed protein product [Brassicogethes aeneus]